MRNIPYEEYAETVAKLNNEYGKPKHLGSYDRWRCDKGSIYLYSSTPGIRKFVGTGKNAADKLRELLGKSNSVDSKSYPAWELVLLYEHNHSAPSHAVECTHCGLMYATNQADDNGYCATCLGKGVTAEPLISVQDVQIGGDHYKHMAIQPGVFCQKNKIGFFESCAIKRLCRYNKPGGKGLEDLRKAIHEIEMVIDIEGLE